MRPFHGEGGALRGEGAAFGGEISATRGGAEAEAEVEAEAEAGVVCLRHQYSIESILTQM